MAVGTTERVAATVDVASPNEPSALVTETAQKTQLAMEVASLPLLEATVVWTLEMGDQGSMKLTLAHH